MVAALLLVAAGARGPGGGQRARTSGRARRTSPRRAPAASPELPLVNQIDFGVRGTIVRHRLRRGAVPALSRPARRRHGRPVPRVQGHRHLPLQRCRPTTSATAISATRRRTSNYGKVKATFEWNQIPLFYSQTTKTLYDTSTPGTLTIERRHPDRHPEQDVHRWARRSTAPRHSTSHTRRDVATVDVIYSATPNVDLGRQLQEHAEDRRLPVGRQLRHQQRYRDRTAGAGRPSDHRRRHHLEYAQRARLRRASATTGRSSSNNVTTLVVGQPGRASPTRRPPVRCRGAWRCGRTPSMNTVSASRRAQSARPQPRDRVPVAGEHDATTNPLLPYTDQHARWCRRRSTGRTPTSMRASPR